LAGFFLPKKKRVVVNNLTFSVVVILASIFFACEDSSTNPEKESTVVFGRFYGFCHGESCIEIFKIKTVHRTEM